MERPLRSACGEASPAILAEYTEEAPAVLPPLGEYAHAEIDRSVQWWRGWLTGRNIEGHIVTRWSAVCWH